MILLYPFVDICMYVFLIAIACDNQIHNNYPQLAHAMIDEKEALCILT